MEFRDLKRQYEKLKSSIDQQISEIITSACFISGSQVKTLEEKLEKFVGVKHCISCANGTDAISISLIAAGVGEQGGGSKTDAVFVPDFTFFSSGECPATIGATPIFVDVSRATYNIDCESLEAAIKKVIDEGLLTPRAVVAVDLFGLPADYGQLRSICTKYNLLLLEDGAQGFGGSYKGIKVGNLGDIATTSFFPAKPLGCYGDGGAIFTNDEKLATVCRSIAVHGKDMEHPDDPMAKYNNVRLGMNSRLDTLQAGILLAKLEAFCSYELEEVNKVANLYTEQLSGVNGLILPSVGKEYYSSWAQYTVQLPEGVDRAEVQKQLKAAGIPTMIYYQKPMHKQGAFINSRSAIADCPNTELLCKSVLCLPIHPYLKEEEVTFVVGILKQVLG